MDPGGWERDIVLCGRVSPAFNVDVVSWWFLDFWCTCCLLEPLLELLFFGREEESDLNGPLFEILFQAYIVLCCTLVWGVDIYSKSSLDFWSHCSVRKIFRGKIHSRQNCCVDLTKWHCQRQCLVCCCFYLLSELLLCLFYLSYNIFGWFCMIQRLGLPKFWPFGYLKSPNIWTEQSKTSKNIVILP